MRSPSSSNLLGPLLAFIVLALLASVAPLPARAAERPPSRPTSLRATATGPTSVRLQWVDASRNEEGFILRDRRGRTRRVKRNTTSYTWRGLARGARHCFRVAAYNAAGRSAWSGQACATTPEKGGHAPEVTSFSCDGRASCTAAVYGNPVRLTYRFRDEDGDAVSALLTLERDDGAQFRDLRLISPPSAGDTFSNEVWFICEGGAAICRTTDFIASVVVTDALGLRSRERRVSIRMIGNSGTSRAASLGLQPSPAPAVMPVAAPSR